MKLYKKIFLLVAITFLLVLTSCTTDNGIARIEKTSTNGLEDTYTIYFTNGEHSNFVVVNDEDGNGILQGIKGDKGDDGKDGHSPIITIQNGFWYIDGKNTEIRAEGIQGEKGEGISSIKKTSTEGLVDTYTITYINGETLVFTVTNGKDGVDGIQGIQGVPGKDGHTPVITIQNGNWYIDGVDTLQSAAGLKGDKGDTGNGISSIKLTSSEGLVDTYTITFTDGATTTFTVTNGKDGVDGSQGIQGIQGVPGKDGHTPVITIQNGNWYIDGVDTHQTAAGLKGDKGDTGNGVSSIKLTSNEGLVDTYTITFTDGTNTTFTVTNGKDGEDGAQGIQGIQGVPGKDGHTPVITIQNGNWYIDGVDTLQTAAGLKGDTGNGISKIEKTSTNGLVDTYTIYFTDGSTTTFEITNGEDGESVSVSIDEEGYWVINGTKTNYLAEGRNDYILELLESYYTIEKDVFVVEKETAIGPYWCYLTSTFSGWGGSIGKPETFEAISVIIRARDIPITKVKFHLNVNDKNGESLFTEVLDVNIGAFESEEIVWILPSKITNNTDSLYLSYNCNQLCDAYINNSNKNSIPDDEYQAVSTYSTNGKLLDSASKMIDVSGKPCCYLYTKIGFIKDILIKKDNIVEEQNKIEVFLPEEYYLTVNDNFQLFYRGVIQAVNPYNYSISVTCSKGKEFPRYFEWTPTEEEIGTYSLKITIRDNNGLVLGSDSTKLIVVKPITENETQNVLCIGDSLTGGGTWVREAQRRFNESGGTPEGLNLNYLNFIGSKQSRVSGSVINHEGYPGWTWSSFCGTSSPFYDETIQDISFKSYCDKHGYEDIDLVYILLTWNGMGEPFKTDFSTATGHFVFAKKIIDKIHEEYPNAQIRCLGIQIPSQNGGMGANYGATGSYSEDYGMLVTAMHYNECLEKFCKQEEYSSFVKYVDVAGQFDTDYNMPSTNKPVNNRNPNTEVIGTNGVHPSVYGYYQIADAVFRSLCEVYSE